jgi:caspase domain-containing protein
VALDGEGRNSPYTKHLVEAIRTRGLNLEGVFKETLKGVYQETDGKQVPWISSSFFGDFAFYPGVANGAGGNSGRVTPPRPQVSAATPRAPVEPAHPPELAGIYHASGTNPNGSRYFGMTSIVASGADYDVTWWIGKQLFHGSGHLAGRMLVVKWGDAHPVIYPIGSTDTLAGEWADGTATETLERFAAASSNPSTSLAGSYRAAGRNPNGSRYNGTVAIREEGSAYRLSWQIGKSAYQGVGRLSGNILVVDWGSSTPVVYAVGNDGVLKGLWEAGRGEETLSPVR